MERCPNCRARVQSELRCPRCGMELELLLTVEQAALEWTDLALGRIVALDWEGARTALRRSLALRQDTVAQSLLGFVDSIEEGFSYGDLPA